MNPHDIESAPFDQYQRYRFSSDIVAAVCGPSCEVLEVGANVHTNLLAFLPSARITFLDNDLSADAALPPNTVLGDARALAMPDGSYDAVVALDMLEHVPEADRARVLVETLRVARRIVVFTFPADDPALTAAEAATNAVWVRHFGEDYRWLAEHALEGLPKIEDIRRIAGECTPWVHLVGHGELQLWRSMMSMHLIKEAFGELAPAVGALDRLYNCGVYAADRAPSVYRQVLVLAKDEASSASVAAHLAAPTRALKPDLPQEIARALTALGSGLDALTGRLGDAEQQGTALRAEGGTLRTEASALRTEIDRLRATADGLDASLRQTTGHLESTRATLAERDARLAFLEGELATQRTKHDELVAALHQIWHSTSWRMTAPYRLVGNRAAQAVRVGRRAPELIRRAGGPAAAMRRAVSLLAAEGPGGLAQRLRHRAEPAGPGAVAGASTQQDYERWIDEIEPGLMAAATAGAADRSTRFSVIMPVFNTDPDMLDAAIHSVVDQAYPHWELCIADDCSSNEATREVLQRWERDEPRVKVVWRERNGHIAEASASALACATGDWIALLDHDDCLAQGAFAAVANRVAQEEDLDLVYSDEDHLDTSGRRVCPFFKPDWSPTLAQRQGYVGHLICIRRSVALASGGFRTGYEGSQDHDLLLRASREARRIAHLPLVLYHWREHARSTASSPGSKPYAHDAGRRAIADHLATRYGDRFDRVDDGEHLFTYTPRFRMPERCRVSIIIPTRDKIEYLEPCIDGILKRSTWRDFEIVVLDNGSVEPRTAEYLARITRVDPRIRVVPCPIPFNWSKLNNIGARESTGDVLLFLNNDIDVISPDWLETLASHCLLPDVGTVGALLLYEDGTIQHAGVIVGMSQWADHVFKAMSAQHAFSPYVSPAMSRNVLAVTGACVAIARSKFDMLGGFDESFVICGSDVELGLRAYRAGLVNEYLAEVRLYHYESKSRGGSVPENDFVESDRKYAPWRVERVDPYFNPNLDLGSSTPRIRTLRP